MLKNWPDTSVSVRSVRIADRAHISYSHDVRLTRGFSIPGCGSRSVGSTGNAAELFGFDLNLSECCVPGLIERASRTIPVPLRVCHD